ncbi:hypothetical protein R1sor_009691 [Riccia sorocarpa]|uniref:Uncharacterized protein n=1 Tax=Riccia sorocarpa TaxID=122646 RepID=A0ABD3HZU1_9MARC
MIEKAVYSVRCASKIYDFCVTFLKISEINVPLQPSRSFPSAGSAGTGRLARRCLKLTALYGTGQREIGEFEVVGNECVIDHKLEYQVYPDPCDSSAVTKLHVYACSYGLTGHVTVDLKEFIEEHDSEIYLEYPLSASNPRHRAAKLKILVRCTFPPVVEDPDFELDHFLSENFPHRDCQEIPAESEIKHLLPGSDFGSKQKNPDAVMRLENGSLDESLYQAKTLCMRPKPERKLLKDLECDLLGLNSKLHKFVTDYAQTKSVFGKYRKRRNSISLSKCDLQAAIFFAAGVTMQQHLYTLQAASVRPEPLVEKQGVPSLVAKNSLILLRSKREDGGVPPVLGHSTGTELAEVVTFSEENLLGLGEELLPESPSPLASRACSTSGTHEPERVESVSMCEEDRTQFNAGSGTSHLAEEIRTEYIGGQRARPLLREDTKVSSQSSKRNSMLFIRNVIGVLFIAGVSFMLGATAGSLEFRPERTGGEHCGNPNQNMEAWREPVNPQLRNSNDWMGKLQSSSSAQYQPTEIPPLLAERDKPPDPFLGSDRKSATLRSDPDEQTVADYPDKTAEEQGSGEESVVEKDTEDYISLVAKGNPVDNHIDQVVRLEPKYEVPSKEPRNFESSEQREESRTAVDSYWVSGKREEVLRLRRMLRATRLD